MTHKKPVIEKIMNKVYGKNNWEADSVEYDTVREEMSIRKRSWAWWQSNAKRVLA